tara:strand:- start:974 stop:1291 length:318 start_codon:yes stop_codon:yes gene_type:complete
MDDELLYGDPEGDPITKPDISRRINVDEEVSLGDISLSDIYLNATSLTSEPVVPAGDIEFESELSKVADIDGAAAGSASSGFSETEVTICINGTPTTGKILFKAN